MTDHFIVVSKTNVATDLPGRLYGIFFLLLQSMSGRLSQSRLSSVTKTDVFLTLRKRERSILITCSLLSWLITTSTILLLSGLSAASVFFPSLPMKTDPGTMKRENCDLQ